MSLTHSADPLARAWSIDALLVDLSVDALWVELEDLLAAAYPRSSVPLLMSTYRAADPRLLAAYGDDFRVQGADYSERHAELWSAIGNCLACIADAVDGE